MNGESLFGSSETWPAQLIDFSGSIAEAVKSNNIKIDQETFTSDNLVNLLQQYRKSLFSREYISENEVKKTFEKQIKHLEIGIMVGVLEKSVKDMFDKLHPITKFYFSINKHAGRKFIDKIYSTEEVKKVIEAIEKIPEYERLTIQKYEVLKK